MITRKKKIIVEVPHRISGFFEIVDSINGVRIEDPIRIGSRGAGFCVDAKGKTEIQIQDFEDPIDTEVDIYINDESYNQKAETTSFIVEYVKKYINKPFKIKINHYFDLPVGCGYGASGSGALGTIFGLNELFNLNLSYQEKGKIAHIAEVINRTGLGTVCGQLSGGMGILKEPGFPCIYERIKVPKNVRIICGSFGMIHTKSILTDPNLNLRIKAAGKKALNKLMEDQNIKKFLEVSIEFVKNTEILEILGLQEIKELIDDLNKLSIIGASMNQLGRSVYVICGKEEEKAVFDILECYKPEIKIFNTHIHEKSAINFKNS